MDYDVIIAGAGPAGSTCARLCAAAGVRTLLLERDAMPRPKPCGGALSERGVQLLGIPLPPELIERESQGVRIRFGRHVMEARKDRRVAVLVDRSRFDQHLADRAVEAGAVLRQEEPLQDASASADRVEITTPQGTYQARCLVGADGAYSVAGRKLRPLFARDEIHAALVGTYPAEEREIAQRTDNLLEFHFGVAKMGYGWVFPHKSILNIGIMGQATEFDAPQQAFSSFAAGMGMPIERPRGHTIPLGGRERPVIGRRTLLAGDAAGFADPFSGAGMENAIFSGKLAAQAVVDGIGGRKDALSWYQRECDRLIVKEMRIALQLARLLVRYPGLSHAMFFSSPEALGRYLDIPLGRSTYAEFRTWLIKRLPGYLLNMLFRTRPALL